MSESTLFKFSVGVQAFYAKITPVYEVDDLIPSNPFIFHLIPVIFVGAYLYLLQVLPEFQKKHNILKTRKNKNIAFVAWNAFLTIYSGITFLYVFTWYIVQIQEKGSFWNVYCPTENEYFHGPNVFWYWTFAVSKYFELFDTILLIIKNPKRDPMFLHWYHHATVVFATWWSFKYSFSPFFFGTMMNTFIHFNMYFYYALTPFFRPPWAFLLTVMQISQMMGGFYVYISWMKDYFVKSCFSNRPIMVSGYIIVLYISYCLLFIQFMLRRYFGIGRKKKKKKDDAEKKE